MPPSTMAPPKRALPSKEASLFKDLLTLYETKQLKKALKTADQILKKFPEHGETLCMKGLVLTHMGKREEGMELVKKGIRFDLTSHICWHVFGLIQKGEKKYEEALKSYMQALKFDKENLNILRDSAHLQMQLRIFDGLVETRRALLRIRPNLRQNWIGLVVALHLNGNLAEARLVMDQYEAILKDIPDRDPERSESNLYRVHLLEELGEISEALALLDSSAKSRGIVDRTAILEYRARLLSKKGARESEDAWRALIERNPDCYDYYSGFLRSQDIDLDFLTDDTRPRALEFLREFHVRIPRANAPQRIALSISSGDEFHSLIEPYVISGLKKGVPSLFSDIKSLYRDPLKRQVVEDLVERIRESLAAGTVLATPQKQADTSSPATEPPTTYLWTLYFLAQHNAFLNRPARAMSLLSLALEHTPTLPELYTCQARVLKRAGDLIGAARSLEEARLLDGQDRFLNTKCAKYCLRAGLTEEAHELLGMFTKARKKDAASPGADLEDMQSLLYLIEEGNSQYQKGRLGLALRKYHAVHKIFDEIEDDQFDFHGYSIRKFTISVYLSLLAWEDKLRSHPAYVAAALSASRIYVAVHDDPSLVTSSSSAGRLESEEAKKAKKKARKAAKKTQDEKKSTPVPSNEDKGLELPPVKNEDPEGTALLSVPDPLEHAAKLLNPLRPLVPQNIDLWIAIFDVAVRRRKFLQAAKALNHARSLDADYPELHIRTVEFRIAVSALPQVPPHPIGVVLIESFEALLPKEVSLERFNAEYLQRHSTSAKASLAAAKVSRTLDASKEAVEAIVFTTLDAEKQLDIKTALECVQYLEVIKSTRTDEFRAACDVRFELSTVFKPPAELALLRKGVIMRDFASGNSDEIEVAA